MPLAWTPHGKEGPVVRITDWDPRRRGLNLEARWRTGDTISVEAPECRLHRVDGLTELQCNGVALILADEAPLSCTFQPPARAASSTLAPSEHPTSWLSMMIFSISFERPLQTAVTTSQISRLSSEL